VGTAHDSSLVLKRSASAHSPSKTGVTPFWPTLRDYTGRARSVDR